MKTYLPIILSDLLSLPTPEKSFLKRLHYSTTRKVAQESLNLWKQMPQEYDTICKCSEIYKCSNCEKKHEISGRDLWCRKFLILGSYYDYSVRKLITLEKKNKKNNLAPGLNIPSYSKFLDIFPKDSKNLDPAFGHLIISSYISSLIPTYFAGLLRNISLPNIPISVFEDQSHKGVYSLFEHSFSAPHRDLRYCLQVLTKGLLDLLKVNYSSENVVYNNKYKFGPFSALLTHELALLASRDKKLMERYGNKYVEKVFEKQLALLFQSYGFYVVATREGQRTIDLICISSDPREPMTILVEAKTSSTKYSLPVKDQRALMEYVKDVKKTLTTLPPLAFVLITGPQPTDTMENRLKDLEAEVQTPMRYISASDLASIRECIVGPLPMDNFRKNVIRSNTRILKELNQPILTEYQSRQQAHSELVYTMLGGTKKSIELNLAQYNNIDDKKIMRNNNCK